MYHFIYETKIGAFLIAADQESIIALTNDLSKKEIYGERNETSLIRKAYQELSAYLKGERTSFSLSLAPNGTAFQDRVWQALCQIPYGETSTYGEIAKKIGNPKACRAVGMANNKNPIMIMIPCHRVIGATGDLIGYAGGMEMKRKLLEIEQSR